MKHIKKYKKGGKKFPDLTGDGKVTFADILKGRGDDSLRAVLEAARREQQVELVDGLVGEGH